MSLDRALSRWADGIEALFFDTIPPALRLGTWSDDPATGLDRWQHREHDWDLASRNPWPRSSRASS